MILSKLKNKRILITGGGGSIGSELVRQLSILNKIYILDIDETKGFDLAEELKQKGYWVEARVGDIRERDTVFNVFSDFKPEIVINASALKHVTPSQTFPREYVLTNIIGNLNLVEECKRWECFEKFVFISTDKAVQNKNVMGATKMCSEVITACMGEKFTVVRFGNVMGSRGSVLEIWRRQVENGEPITITDPEMKRYFMSIPQACNLVIQAIEQPGQIHILDMGQQKTILELKQEFFPNYPHTIIGIRPGETMDEELMSQEEKQKATKQGEFYVI